MRGNLGSCPPLIPYQELEEDNGVDDAEDDSHVSCDDSDVLVPQRVIDSPRFDLLMEADDVPLSAIDDFFFSAGADAAPEIRSTPSSSVRSRSLLSVSPPRPKRQRLLSPPLRSALQLATVTGVETLQRSTHDADLPLAAPASPNSSDAEGSEDADFRLACRLSLDDYGRRPRTETAGAGPSIHRPEAAEPPPRPVPGGSRSGLVPLPGTRLVDDVYEASLAHCRFRLTSLIGIAFPVAQRK